MLTKDNAICIRASDYSETSQVVTLFTKAHGKISAIAKGSKRAKSSFDGPLEPLACGKIVFAATDSEKLSTLTEFQQARSFSHLTGNLFALNCSLFAAELLNNLTDDYDRHPQLFDSFLRFLQDTNKKQQTKNRQRNMLSLLILFQLSLLREIGLMPVLNACANCKTRYERRATSDEFYFSSSANGIICKDCEMNFPDKIRLTKNAANALSNLKLIGDANEKTLNEIEKILISHFTDILGRRPKMAKYVISA